ncbi:TetR/AcrR family transcriptional regulator [filamentous cyanobacterium LEGE 11480]|uniref:TetR/AcrR family transcriptional regulator n=1 Tax=Romeriopsis navalis LEGE 11480 TaxID=2777977 RepID=A0A928Z6D4_9CYAN|nr:TetR/AcrR family transcriptional regulator [Romeriopsis navalis]MBE9032508.1 TetR/AcrR family transcriptional regulator [Romeriopsis navalis LEGE 11480]
MPKIVDHELYRQELLGKSFHLFADRGYAAITMRQLATGLGVSTGTLYHYFPSKQVIFEQMVLMRLAKSLNTFGDRLAQIDSIREKVEATFAYYADVEVEALREVMLCMDFFQYQQQQGGENILTQVYDRIKPEVVRIFGLADDDLVQLVVSALDGLLIAKIYGCQVNWQRQGELIGQLVEQCQNQSK